MNKHAPGGRRCDGAVGRDERGRVWTTGEHNMERRKFVLGVGALAAGGAAAVGSGAFTNVEADRSFGVTTATDSGAFLGIAPTSDANGVYAFEYGDDVEIYLEDADNLNGNMGSGVNVQAVTQIDKVFKITNQGSQDYDITIDDSNLASPDTSLDPEEVFTFYVGTSPDNDAIESGDIALSPGESLKVGIEVDLSTYGGDYNGSKILADDGGYGNLRIKATATE